jgi:hypothetical protein
MGGQPLALRTGLPTAFSSGGGVVREPGVTRGRHSVFYTGELPPWDESLGAFRCLEGCCGPAVQPPAAATTPIDGECPDCLAAPGESCKRSVSGKPRHKPHAARRKALRQASNAAV